MNGAETETETGTGTGVRKIYRSPLEGLLEEVEKQIKERNFVNIIIDKETIDKMRAAGRIGVIGGGGVKNYSIRNYSIREDTNWIRTYIKRKLKVEHKLTYFIGGTEIHIMSAD